MNKEATTGTQGLECILVEWQDNALGNRATDVGHEHDVKAGVADWPVWTCRIQLHKVHSVLDVLRLLRFDAFPCSAHLWQLQDGGLEAGRGLCEDIRESS